MQPWLLSTPLIVSGGGGVATLFSLLLSIWCHWKWNFISYSAAIALDRAHQDKADSFLQICLSCGTINHDTLNILQTCSSSQLLGGVCTVNWLLQGSRGLWYAKLALLLFLGLSSYIDRRSRSRTKWEHHLVLLVYNPGEQFPVDKLDHNTDQTQGSVFVRLIGKTMVFCLLWHSASSKLQNCLAESVL